MMYFINNLFDELDKWKIAGPKWHTFWKTLDIVVNNSIIIEANNLIANNHLPWDRGIFRWCPAMMKAVIDCHQPSSTRSLGILFRVLKTE